MIDAPPRPVRWRPLQARWLAAVARRTWRFIAAVPLLAPIDPIVQLDLLGEVWARQRVREPIEATLLDAAVVRAAFAHDLRGLLIKSEIQEALELGWRTGLFGGTVAIYVRRSACRL